jgi:hypothetical protein
VWSGSRGPLHEEVNPDRPLAGAIFESSALAQSFTLKTLAPNTGTLSRCMKTLRRGLSIEVQATSNLRPASSGNVAYLGREIIGIERIDVQLCAFVECRRRGRKQGVSVVLRSTRPS